MCRYCLSRSHLSANSLVICENLPKEIHKRTTNEKYDPHSIFSFIQVGGGIPEEKTIKNLLFLNSRYPSHMPWKIRSVFTWTMFPTPNTLFGWDEQNLLLIEKLTFYDSQFKLWVLTCKDTQQAKVHSTRKHTHLSLPPKTLHDSQTLGSIV